MVALESHSSDDFSSLELHGPVPVAQAWDLATRTGTITFDTNVVFAGPPVLAGFARGLGSSRRAAASLSASGKTVSFAGVAFVGPALVNGWAYFAGSGNLESTDGTPVQGFTAFLG